ncbi:restriction endonuclease subunit S [Phaeobacter sp. CAU 1743]|uniref:restriction endonuclease subunit S n=1 Tax=Phaeobacter sp. CAU 1743 TaxID=3140367 RepID=UPI00325A70E4
MTDAPTNLMVPTYPRSVQPGIPRLSVAPEGWSTRRFGELLKVVQRPVRMTDDGEYDLVTVKRSRGGIESRGRFRGKDISVKSQFALEGGDFLISKRQIVHGACAVVPDEFAGSIVSNEYSVLRCKPGLDLGFLRYLSHSVYFQQTCFHSSIGVHVEKMIFKLEDWLKFRVNVPPLEEQKRIAAGFEAVDAKLAALREKADGLRQFKIGLMQRLFSQELRFTREDGSNFPDWEERKLGSFGELYGGLSGKSAEDFGEGVPFITYRQVFESARIDVSKFALVKIGPKEKQNRVVFGDVLMTTSSETPSEVGFASVMLDEVEDLYLNSFCFGYRPYDLKALLPEFSKYLFRSPLYRREVIKLAQGSTRFNISRTGFLKIKLLFPHPEEQEKIAGALSALDAKIDAVTDQISLMEAFKKGLLQKTFV